MGSRPTGRPSSTRPRRSSASACPRGARRLGAPHPGPAVRICRDRARRAASQVIIAGAGGAAHLPGMMRGQDVAARARRAGAVEGAERHRLAALDRADAGRHPGRRRWPSARPARPTRRCWPRRSSANKHPRSARRSTRSAPRRPTRSSPSPTRAARRSRHEDRHPRRGPARPHAGAGGLSARRRVPVPRPAAPMRPAARSPRSSRARSTIRTASSGSRPRSTSSPTNSRTCRSRRCSDVAATRPVWPPVEALRVSQDRLLEKQLFRELGSRRRRSAPSIRCADLARPRCDVGPARRPQDAAPRLRRQGPARACASPPISSPRGMRSAARR